MILAWFILVILFYEQSIFVVEGSTTAPNPPTNLPKWGNKKPRNSPPPKKSSTDDNRNSPPKIRENGKHHNLQNPQ